MDANALMQSLPSLLSSFTGGGGAGAGTAAISPSAMNQVSGAQSDIQFQLAQLLQRSAESCGVECQKKKKVDALKQRFTQLQLQEQTLPTEKREAEAAYLRTAMGEVEYDKHREKELQDESAKIAAEIQAKLEKECELASTMLSYLETTTRNYAHLMEYKKTQELEETNLKTSAEELEETLFTNQRKTYYEYTGIETLNWWYKAIWFIYFVLVLVFVFVCVKQVRAGESSMGRLVGGALALVTLPYWLTPLLRMVYGLGLAVYNQTPRSAYNTLND